MAKLNIYFFLMKELGLSYGELQEMPVPALFALVEKTNEYNREQEKKMKKAQRK